MKLSRGRLFLGATAAVLSVAIALLAPERRTVVLESAIVWLFALTVLEVRHQIKTLVPDSSRSYFDRSFFEPVRTLERPADLRRLESDLSWNTYERMDFEHRVVPLVRRLVSARLLEHRGIDMSRHPETALAVLPPILKLLVPAATNRTSSLPEPLDRAFLEELLDAVEAV